MSSINKTELLMYIKSVSSERSIPYESVLDMFTQSLAQSLRKASPHYSEAEFRVEIDPRSGDLGCVRRWTVLGDEEEMDKPQQQIPLKEACERSGVDNLVPGDIFEAPMENPFGQRASMQSAKQYFNIHLRDFQRRALLKELNARDEDLVTGQVTRILRDRGDAIVEVSRVDCRLPRNEIIPREPIKEGDKVKALIKEVIESEGRGQQIILTRTSPEFLVRLFQRTVPEIEKNILEVVKAVRCPGNRAKIAVRSNDVRVDPVGTCVGTKGSRVQTVTSELDGERIDIIHWSEDDAEYVLRAMAPAEIRRIDVDRGRRRMNVLVDQSSMAQALGKNGTNVRLASELTGWDITVHTPEDYESESNEIATRKSKRLAEALTLDVDVARILYDEGFEVVDDIAYAEPADLEGINGFNAEVVAQIQDRAREAAEERAEEVQERLKAVDRRLLSVRGMSDDILYDLAVEGIIKLEQLADMDLDEVLQMLEVSEREAADLIMRAREIVAAHRSREDA